MFRAGLWSTRASQSLLAGLKINIVILEMFMQAHQHINREGLCRGSSYCADFLRRWGKACFRAISWSLTEKSCSPEDWRVSARNSDGQFMEMHEKITFEGWINWLQLDRELGRAKVPRVCSSPAGLPSNCIWTALAQGCCILLCDNSYLLLYRDSVFKET